MSCKYCDIKMRPLDDDLKVLKGESWKDEFGEGGYIGQLYNDKFQMLVYYDAGCACTGVPDVKYCPFCGEKLKMPKEPLIEDEKIRKAVQAWAEANDMSSDSVVICGSFDDGFETDTSSIEFDCTIRDALRGLKRGKSYTITELCGEGEDDGKTVS